MLHIIREADLSLAADDISGLGISVGSEGDVERDDNYLLSAATAAAASRNILRPPSMQSLLENMPDSSDIPDGSSSGGGSQGKGRCEMTNYESVISLCSYWVYGDIRMP